MIVAIKSHQGALHMQISTIGLDIAKNVFQVHGIDAAEKAVAQASMPIRHGGNALIAAAGIRPGQEARTDLQAGRSLFAAHSRRRRALCPAARKAEPAEISLAHATLGAAAVQGRGGRAGQQNGAHGMGVAGQGRRLSGACARSNGLRGLATGG